MKCAEVIHQTIMSDHMAQQINTMAKSFFSDPQNIEVFVAWHIKTYGCSPSTMPQTVRG